MTIVRKLSLTFAAVIAAQIVISLLALFQVPAAIMWCIRAAYLASTMMASILFVRNINRRLGQIIQEIAGGAEQVSAAAAQIATASHSVAQGTSQQAASLEETSASTEEINSMARRNTENSYAANGLVKQSDRTFAEANRSLEEMVSAMAEINTSSDKISKIIKVIDEIAFQTNILALNAAVEAARAGEAGMGFAVVADEVRNLAQRCAQAARDTAVLIEESITKSNDGKLKVDHVTRAIQKITDQSSQIKTLVDEVHLGSQEQSRGIDQISKAIVQMEQLTQKAAASAEESASTAEQLKAQSSSLKNVVLRLNTSITRTEQSAPQKQSPGRPSAQVPQPSKDVRSGMRNTMNTNIAALRNAVSKDAPPKHALMSVEVPEKDPFPMDESFQEF